MLEILLGFLLPVVFYGSCLLAEDITKTLATITAVVVAGCVSMIVLQENKKIEDLKLDEKWIYEARSDLNEITDGGTEGVSEAINTIREMLGLDRGYHNGGEDFYRINITEEMKEEAYEKFKEMFDNEEFNKSWKLQNKLETMLEACPRSTKALLDLKTIKAMVIHSHHCLKKKTTKEAPLALTALTYLTTTGYSNASKSVSSFLSQEISRSKKGGVSARRNIKSLYIGILMTLLCYAAFVMVDNYLAQDVEHQLNSAKFVIYYI